MPENHSQDPAPELPKDLEEEANSVKGPEPNDIFSSNGYQFKRLGIKTTSTNIMDRMQETVDAMEMLAVKSLASDGGLERAARKPVKGKGNDEVKKTVLKRPGEVLQRARDMFKGDFEKTTDKHMKEILEYTNIVTSLAFVRYRNVETPALIKDTKELKDALEAKRVKTLQEGGDTTSLDRSIKKAEQRLILLGHIRRSLWGVGEAVQFLAPQLANGPTSAGSHGHGQDANPSAGGVGSEAEYEDVDEDSEGDWTDEDSEGDWTDEESCGSDMSVD